MAGYIVHEPVGSPRGVLSGNIGGIFVNAESAGEAIARAETLLALVTNPSEAKSVRSWATQVMGTRNTLILVNIFDDNAGAGELTVSIGGDDPSDPIALSSSAAEIATLINASITVEGGYVTVEKTTQGSNIFWRITLHGAIYDVVTYAVDDTGLLVGDTAEDSITTGHAAPDFVHGIEGTIILGQCVFPGQRLPGSGNVPFPGTVDLA